MRTGQALQQRSRSLVAKKNYRRSVVVSSVAPAGGVAITGCPARTDPRFEQGTAAGTIEHAAAVREWMNQIVSKQSLLPLVASLPPKSPFKAKTPNSYMHHSEFTRSCDMPQLARRAKTEQHTRAALRRSGRPHECRRLRRRRPCSRR